MTNVYNFHAGYTPLLISIPHGGTEVPSDIYTRLTDTAKQLPDTDWHVVQLYSFAKDLGASIIDANYSRYVVDLNRPPDGARLYPGQRETGICPIIDFLGNPIYNGKSEPDVKEISTRIDLYWRPYHEKINAALDDIKQQFGYAILWDAHSIRSVIPGLFDGRLPDFNLGTANGASCPVELANNLLQIIESDHRFTAVLNGRFKGGYITRHYGQPKQDVTAIQLELAQACYMNEASPYKWEEQQALAAREVISTMLTQVISYPYST